MSVLAALLLVLVLPSVAGMLLLSPPPPLVADPDNDGVAALATEHDVVLARGVACGVATWLMGSGVLARTVGVTPTTAWSWSALVALVSIVVVVHPRQRSRWRTVLAPAGRRLAQVAGLTGLVYLPVAVVVLRSSASPIGSTPWFYYGLARQIAEAGHVPSTSVEFGIKIAFLNDYHLFSTGTAMLLVQHHGNPVPVLTAVTFVGVLTLALGSVALATAMRAGRLAALLAVPLAIGTGIATARLTGYRPEGFGLGLSILIVALAAAWLRSRDWRSLLAAALLVATLSQVHGIAALCSGVMVVAVALALLSRDRWRPHARRVAVTLAAFVGAVLVTLLLFRGASGTTSASGRLFDQGGMDDPTWLFYRAARGDPMSSPPSNGGMLYGTLHGAYARSVWWIVPILVVAVVALRRRWSQPASRQVVAYTLWSLLGLALVSSVFMLGWQGYVPRRTGASRIPLEASLLTPTLLAVGLGRLGPGPWTVRGRTLRRPRVVLLGLVTACAIVTTTSVALYNDGNGISATDLAVWKSMPLTSKDVVLANGYTEGFIPDVSPAVGLLDGRAPYTFGPALHRANDLLRGAHAFYTHPARRWDFLAAHHVTWVVVGQPDSFSLSTGNIWYAPRSLHALERCHGLRQWYAGSSLTVFRVTDPGPGGCSG